MAKHNISLLIAMVLALIIFIITMVFSALAAPGIYPFLYGTGNISDLFVTEITPSGWTFSIWSIIYIFLALVLVYVLSGICRKNAYGYVYCSPALLPHGFFLAWCFNLTLNIGWLFLWDRRVMPAALFFLILVALTNYTMIFFSCYGLNNYGAWLNKYHKVDLWLHRVLIQNGIAIYATWTTIATLVNLTITLAYDADVSSTDAATISLSLLTVVLIVCQDYFLEELQAARTLIREATTEWVDVYALYCWFILENSILDKYVRFIQSIYPSVIWALTGVFTKNYNASAPTRNNVFIAVLLAIACILFVTRVLLVTWRQIKMPFYRDVNPDDMSPMEIANRQKKIFK